MKMLQLMTPTGFRVQDSHVESAIVRLERIRLGPLTPVENTNNSMKLNRLSDLILVGAVAPILDLEIEWFNI